MRSSGIVVVPPTFDSVSGVVQRYKPGGIQALGQSARLERLDIRMIRWFAGSREGQRDVVGLRPGRAARRVSIGKEAGPVRVHHPCKGITSARVVPVT